MDLRCETRDMQGERRLAESNRWNTSERRLQVKAPDWREEALAAGGEALYFVPRGVAYGSPEMRVRVLLEHALTERDGRRCFYCGYDRLDHPRPNRSMAIDHVHPRRRNGSDCIENLVWSCQHCNLLKRETPAWFFVLWLWARRDIVHVSAAPVRSAA